MKAEASADYVAMLESALRMIARYPYPAINGSFSQQEIARAALNGGQDPESLTRLLVQSDGEVGA